MKIRLRYVAGGKLIDKGECELLAREIGGAVWAKQGRKMLIVSWECLTGETKADIERAFTKNSEA